MSSHVRLLAAVSVLSVVIASWVLPSPADADGKGANLALQGYDPVAYFTMARPALGKPEHELTFDETRYRFYSNEHREAFRADPERYEPQYQGLCAMGLGAKGYKVVADPHNWAIHNGRLYVTQREFGPAAFRGAPDRWIASAEIYLAALRDLPVGSAIGWW